MTADHRLVATVNGDISKELFEEAIQKETILTERRSYLRGYLVFVLGVEPNPAQGHAGRLACGRLIRQGLFAEPALYVVLTS